MNKKSIATLVTIRALMLACAGYAAESTANPKDKPDAAGAIEVDAITATSKVTAVDSAKRTVTLTNEAGKSNTDTQARTVTVKGPMGGKPTLKVGPKVSLNELQQGDDVTLRVTEALAISVEKP